MRARGLERGHPWGMEHLHQVKQLPCACCGKHGPSRAHHRNARAMGAKASDFESMPLCDLHHDGGVPGASVHAGLRIWQWDEQELVEQTWAKLQASGIIPPGVPVGQPYEPRRSVFRK